MIDSHAHVADTHFDLDRTDVIDRARTAQVRWVEIGTTLSESEAALSLAEQWPESILGATVGVHPNDISTDLNWPALENMLGHDRVVAIGEVGLDYSRDGKSEVQLPVLERFVHLAVERELPIVFHVRSSVARDAHEDMLAFLQGLPTQQRPQGVMHTFSGTWTQAQRYLKLGLHISLSGVVTFKNAPDMHEVAAHIPLERLLIETDCPYLTPDPHRGARNEPVYVEFVARRIAELRGISFEEVAAVTEKNAVSLFELINDTRERNS